MITGQILAYGGKMMLRKSAAVACFIFLMGAFVLPSLVLAGSATVTWQPNTESDLAKYRVYWSTTAGAYGSYKAEVAKGTTTYAANNLTDGQTYYFVLTAVDASGNESGFSSPPASKTIPGGSTGVPPAPALEYPANGSTVPGTSITFRWKPSQGATDYIFRQWRQNGTLSIELRVGNVTSYTVPYFSNSGYTNSWSVTALNASGQGPASERWTFTNGPITTSPDVPLAPSLTSPAGGANVAGTSVTFSWQAAQGATDYNLKVYNSSGALTFDQWLGNVLSRTVTGFLNQGQSYSWSVTARNATGQGPASAQRSFVNGSSTPSGGPVLLSPANGSTIRGTSITFQWQKAPTSTYNRIRVYTSTGAVFYDRWVSSSVSHTVSGFRNDGRSYSWEIYPYNSSGLGVISPRWTFVNR
jgi:fibronectin type 3 domain-containing protein